MERRILRPKHIPAATGLSLRTIQRLEAVGQFPAHVKLTERTIGWPANEVAEWVEARIGEREAA